MKQALFLQVLMVVALFGFSSALAQDEPVTNDETQGMLRVTNCVFGSPNVDVLVNGEVPVNGSVPLADEGFGVVTGYLYLAPGTYSVAVVPTGEGAEEALMETVDVSVQAGHRYTVAVVGQADEPSHTPLVIDETAAYQAIGALPSDSTQIIINNLRGVSGIDYSIGGEVWLENVPYGGYRLQFGRLELSKTRRSRLVVHRRSCFRKKRFITYPQLMFSAVLAVPIPVRWGRTSICTAAVIRAF